MFTIPRLIVRTHNEKLGIDKWKLDPRKVSQTVPFCFSTCAQRVPRDGKKRKRDSENDSPLPCLILAANLAAERNSDETDLSHFSLRSHARERKTGKNRK